MKTSVTRRVVDLSVDDARAEAETGVSNQPPHPTAAPRCGFGFNGFIGRWIRCQCPLPAAVGELTSFGGIRMTASSMDRLWGSRPRRPDSSAKGNALVTRPHTICRPARARLGRVSPPRGGRHCVVAGYSEGVAAGLTRFSLLRSCCTAACYSPAKVKLCCRWKTGRIRDCNKKQIPGKSGEIGSRRGNDNRKPLSRERAALRSQQPKPFTPGCWSPFSAPKPRLLALGDATDPLNSSNRGGLVAARKEIPDARWTR
jgi:hypothetical protein